MEIKELRFIKSRVEKDLSIYIKHKINEIETDSGVSVTDINVTITSVDLLGNEKKLR